MTAFPAIDMAEVTRLTRAGRLSEAMALLQGRPVSADRRREAPGTVRAARGGHASTLDLEAPSRPTGAWHVPEPSPEGAASGAAPTARGDASRRRGLADALRILGERVPGLAGAPNRADGLGASRGAPASVPAGARFEERRFANEAGERAYKIYVPSGYTGQALPVVVMLHGCTQSPDDFAAGTRMNVLAEEQTFLAVYPAQARSANAQRCWNWFNFADQQREGGEPALLAGIARAVVDEFRADPGRVYVGGLSAGGAAASVLAVTHPDVFAAVGVHSGLPCGAAKDMPSAFAAMKGGGTVRGGGTRTPVPTIVFHGDADRTVSPVNGDRVVAQAMPDAPSNETTVRGETPGGVAYTRLVRLDASGRAILEQWVLHGVGHAWSGGSTDGSYTEPRGPDASREMVRFFMAHTRAR